MNIDVTEHITAATRSVGTRTLEAGEAHTVVISRVYDTTIEDLWEACTSAERIPRWFLPISGELKLGGRYQLEGNAGGIVESCDPPNGFTATWEFGGGVTWIELRLTTADSGTRFELEHIGQIDDEQWAEYGPGAVGIGWDSALMGLGKHVAGDAPVEPAEVAVWMASAEGKEFFSRSSDEWCAAHIASGADEAVARESAKRTTAAYTATPG